MFSRRGARRRGRRVTVALAGLAAGVIFVPSALAETDSVRFEYGDNGTWTVPDRVTEIQVEVAGGGGGGTDYATITGGDGALVEATVNTSGGEELLIAVGGGGEGLADGSTGGGGGGGASTITSSSAGLSDLLIIAGGGGGAGRGDAEARSSSGGDAGVNTTNGAGANSARVDGYSINGKRGANGNGGFSNLATSKGLDYVAGSSTDTGEGGGRKTGIPGALVGGAGSAAGSGGGRGGAGYGGGGEGGRVNTSGVTYSLGGGGGGSTAQGTVVEFVSGETTYYSSNGGAGGTVASRNGRDGWIVITWVVPAPLPAPEDSAKSVGPRAPVVFEFAMPAGMECEAPRSDSSGLWVQLPAADQCSGGVSARSGSTPELLGWATQPDFPVDIAQRQVDNGWGAYELVDEAGRLQAVHIPAGGWARASADTSLFPIWGQLG